MEGWLGLKQLTGVGAGVPMNAGEKAPGRARRIKVSISRP
jgi:hypothetical protein